MGYYATNNVSVEAYTMGVGPLQSLTGVSATSAVPVVFDAGTVRPNATLVVTASSGVSAGVVALQASMDGVNFFAVPSATITTSAAGTSQVTSTSAFARYFQAKITTTVTGGTVNAWVGASG
jgi:hypothetical protein